MDKYKQTVKRIVKDFGWRLDEEGILQAADILERYDTEREKETCECGNKGSGVEHFCHNCGRRIVEVKNG